MIFGIGVDLVDVRRIEHSLKTHGERFAARILSDVELLEFKQQALPAPFLAKRFAAKEAAAKALGTGFRHGISLKHIFLTHDREGKPHLNLVENAQKVADEKNVVRLHISLADEKHYAVAYVVLETA